MSVFENLVAGGSAGAATGVGVLFLTEGNRFRKEGDKKSAAILLTAGAIVGLTGICHFVNLLRK
jgi:hypothetical protein